MNKISKFEELYEHPELLNEKQKIGLKYYNDMNMRIPMSEGKKHYKIIDKIFKRSIKILNLNLQEVIEEKIRIWVILIFL